MHLHAVANIDHLVARARGQLRFDPVRKLDHAPTLRRVLGVYHTTSIRYDRTTRASSLPPIILAAATTTLLAITGAATIAITIFLARLATTATGRTARIETRTRRTAEATARRTIEATAATAGRTAEAATTAAAIATAAAAAGRTAEAATTAAAITTTTAAGWATERATTTAAAGSTRLTLASFIDTKLATVELLAVELLQRLSGTFWCRHLDEREAARATCFAIHDDGHASYFAAVGTECISK
jgi:hypothetical protein